MAASVEHQIAELMERIDNLHCNCIAFRDTNDRFDICTGLAGIGQYCSNDIRKDIRTQLERYVYQFLEIIPFAALSTWLDSTIAAEILRNSARRIPHFSILKAANAFREIEKCAASLFSKCDWKNIKKGRFVTITSQQFFLVASLSGAEQLFRRMGYIIEGRNLKCIGVPVGSLDHAVRAVAKVCLFAYVECQVVAEIVRKVSCRLGAGTCSVKDVLDYRRNHIGTTERFVRDLIHLKTNGGLKVTKLSTTNEEKTLNSQNIRDSDLCKICMDKETNSVILECGHLAVCFECAQKLHRCPICRTSISRVAKTFKS